MMNISMPQTFNELSRNLLTTGVSSCTSGCSESVLFELLFYLAIRSSCCSTIFSNKLVISFMLSLNSYFSFPSLCSTIVALSQCENPRTKSESAKYYSISVASSTDVKSKLNTLIEFIFK